MKTRNTLIEMAQVAEHERKEFAKQVGDRVPAEWDELIIALYKLRETIAVAALHIGGPGGEFGMDAETDDYRAAAP